MDGQMQETRVGQGGRGPRGGCAEGQGCQRRLRHSLRGRWGCVSVGGVCGVGKIWERNTGLSSGFSAWGEGPGLDRMERLEEEKHQTENEGGSWNRSQLRMQFIPVGEIMCMYICE